MAPEQASGENALVDARTDVYGLGAVLYALLTGRPPFERRGRPIAVVIAEVCLRDPPSPAQVRRGLPRDLVAIVGQAMAKERERRYPSALEVALDLERFGRGESVKARPPGVGARVARLLARHWLALAMAGGLVVVALGVAVAAAIRASQLAARLELPAAIETARSRAANAFRDANGVSRGDVTGVLADAATLESIALRLPDLERRTLVLVDTARLLTQADLTQEADALLARAAREAPESLDVIDAQHDLAHQTRRPCDELRAKIHAIARTRPEAAGFEQCALAEEASARGDQRPARALGISAAESLQLPRGWRAVRGRALLYTTPKVLRVAANELTQAVVALPGDPPLLADLALATLWAGDAQGALVQARDALARNERLATAHQVIAEVSIMKCDWRQAEASLDRWEALVPVSEAVRIWAIRGRMYAHEHEGTRALEWADRVLGVPSATSADRSCALATRVAALVERGDQAAIAKALDDVKRFAEGVVKSDLGTNAVDYQETVCNLAWVSCLRNRLLLERDGQLDSASMDAMIVIVAQAGPQLDPFTRVLLLDVESRVSYPRTPAQIENIRATYEVAGIEVPRPIEEKLQAIEARIRK
jgi:hypothetical protein